MPGPFQNNLPRPPPVVVSATESLQTDRTRQKRGHAQNATFGANHRRQTSEWEGCKWGPLTRAPSLADENGYFRPMTSQRKDFPPNTGFLEAKPNLAEVEAELRAQIEMAKRHIPRLSHVSAHHRAPPSEATRSFCLSALAPPGITFRCLLNGWQPMGS